VEVIIDNMLNLELLWWAAANGGSSEYYDMASSHADRMIQDAFQPFNPGCVWHLMTYDYTDGTLLNRSSTPQGLGLNTVWSRGQGWATLGFMIAYRYSQQAKYLATAQNAADCFIRLLEASPVSSSDFIPLWDFNATTPQLYGRDTSAAMIAADGMIELAWHLTDPNQKSKYLAAARKMLDSAATIYIETPARSPAVLNNGTSSFPGTNYPLIYGDYYFLEAQMKWDATPAEWRADAAKWAAVH
jgi:unsaturated chondroitin disaccharide hydrolase